MRWFRSNRIFGAQAALFALIVQFAVAFGHVHVGNANENLVAPAAVARNIGHDELNSPAPSDHGQDSADGWCSICATVQLTGSAQAAGSPILPLPVTYSVKRRPLLSETAADDLRCFELRSRGPPQG
jgi:hypothetical protein